MSLIKLIADSGATKTAWCLLIEGKKKQFSSQGISPYLMQEAEITDVFQKEVFTKIKKHPVAEIYYYGTGCANPANQLKIKKSLSAVFAGATKIQVESDLLGAAKAVCGTSKGIVSILGTGSNSCYFNGKKIVFNSPGLGYVLGDEGSGAYLGKRVIQHFLYQVFDEELRESFINTYHTNHLEILEQVYQKPLPARFMASFTGFLTANRGHYMIENIIEDGLNDFFFQHLLRFKEVWKHPVHFIGGVAWIFSDVIKEMCKDYKFNLGSIQKEPMKGLIDFHLLN